METNITDTKNNLTPPELISMQISNLTDWLAALVSRLCKLTLDVAPDITEEWKWGNSVWTHKGMLCSAAIFKDQAKLNFLKVLPWWIRKGSSMPD